MSTALFPEARSRSSIGDGGGGGTRTLPGLELVLGQVVGREEVLGVSLKRRATLARVSPFRTL